MRNVRLLGRLDATALRNELDVQSFVRREDRHVRHQTAVGADDAAFVRRRVVENANVVEGTAVTKQVKATAEQKSV